MKVSSYQLVCILLRWELIKDMGKASYNLANR